VVFEGRVFRSFVGFHRALERGVTRLHRDSIFLGFCAELSRYLGNRDRFSSAAGREYRAVRRAREFLDQHFDRNVPLKELASVADLSPFYFHRVFCRETGMPPHAYQIQLRLIRAKALLRKGQPLALVASATGFADQSHLHRHFRRLMGVTPAEYAGRGKIVQDAARLPR
jgi:AraC-like DNA-binding protein